MHCGIRTHDFVQTRITQFNKLKYRYYEYMELRKQYTNVGAVVPVTGFH